MQGARSLFSEDLEDLCHHGSFTASHNLRSALPAAPCSTHRETASWLCQSTARAMSLGLLWYAATLVAAYIYLLGSTLGKLLSPTEAIFAAIPVGTICGAWVIYFIASLVSVLGCVAARGAADAQAPKAPQRATMRAASASPPAHTRACVWVLPPTPTPSHPPQPPEPDHRQPHHRVGRG